MDGANTSSSSSLTAAQTGRWTYDVFVSFRGKDTRNNFVDHLYAALDQAGVHTFKDDKKLIKGKPITPELAKAIEESMVAVVVFSRNYANSCWCLEELVKIIECRDLMGQTVLPVFYDVAPSEVRNQDGRFLNAFESHKLNLIGNMEKINRWRGALVTAANLVGCNVPQTASGHEAECIKQIVWNCLKYTEIQPADNLIGMESRMRHVKSLLGKRSGNVCVIGIWGMGGIGKTTISRAVYRRISYEFDGSSFLNNVREIGSDETGLKSLQEKLLSDILMQEHFKVKDCYDGRCQIQKRMSSKKVLVVLDDVDNLKQLEFLVGTHEWFGPGTRIIITTRDEHLLSYAHEKYAPQLLNKTEATELFCRYAFKENIPPKDYEKLSSVVVSYTGHLPLALKVLGSHFFDRNLGFWQSALNVLTKIPHKDINEILKLSYNGLSDFEKKILLHIACFFKGWRRDYVTKVLDCCGFEAVSGITVLIEKSLLTVSNGYLHMHDLIQQMGQCIDSECYPHTMAWISKDIKEVMKTSAIALNLSQNGPITKMIGLAMCCRICRQSGDDGFLKIKFKASCDVKMIKRPASPYGDTGDVLWIGYLSIDILENVCHSFESEDLMIFDSYNDIEECGVCVVYRDDIKGMTRTESRIPDYDELKRINHTSEINENLQHGGWSKPTFSFKTENFGDDNTIRIHY